MVPWMIPMALAAATPSWPGYRGPNSAGTAADAQPPTRIGPKENVAWSVEVPPSPSSPTVWGDRLFLTTFNAGELETRAYASPVGAEDRIYVASLDGKLTVVKAGGTKPEVLHTADFGERIAATPALVGKRLYLRTHTRLYAFQAP
jgi:hypothetical protein